MSDQLPPYDSFLLVSFGGPEGPDDVMPFLENVLRGKRVPRERMLEVAEHYKQFGGVSPINEQNRKLLAAIEQEFKTTGVDLPVYWGNRNWDPMLPDTLRQMRDDGCKRALAFFTSMFSCYSGCRQYRENIINAQAEVGEGAPIVEKVRMGFNHPGFIGSVSDAVREAISSLPNTNGNSPNENKQGGNEQGGNGQASATEQKSDTAVLFTAHSIPLSMSDNCDYVKQLNESCRLVAEACGVQNWQLVYQSRSGPPQQPWLEPDICDTIAKMHDEEGLSSLVVCPIGFISDHMEVLFDLDEEAAQACQERGIPFARAATAGTDTAFVSMIRELVEERLGRSGTKSALGELGPWHDVCPADCCLYTPKRP